MVKDQSISVAMDNELFQKIKKKSEELKISMAGLVRIAIVNFVK